MTEVRPATAQDCDHFPHIERDAGRRFAEFAHLAWIADAPVRDAAAWRELVAEGHSLVAEPLIGFVVAARHGDHLHVEELSVLRAHHRQGIGRELLTRTTGHARELGVAGVTLSTFRDVPWNAPWYARHGFAIVPDGSIAHLKAARDFERSVGLRDEDRCAMLLTL